MKITTIGLTKISLTAGIRLENMGNEMSYILESDSPYIDNVNYLVSKGINAIRTPKEGLEEANVCILLGGWDDNEDMKIQRFIKEAKIIGENMSKNMLIFDTTDLSSDILQFLKNVIQEALDKRNSNLTFDVISDSSFHFSPHL
jgi:hypothetical protein